MAQVRKDKVQVEIEINGQKRVGKTISDLQKMYKDLNGVIRELPIGTEEYNREVAKLKNVKSILDEQRSSFRNINRELHESRGLMTRFKDGIKRIGPAVAAAFSLGAVVNFFNTIRERAREIQGAGRRFDTVFGDAGNIVTRFADTTATKMGLAIDQFKQAAAAVGDLLIPMGFTREEAANLTNETLDLAGALSEWTGGQYSAQEAANILTKAYLGEREELKSLGIAISEADVQQRLAAKGQKDLTGTALQQAKALATLELITEKSTDAQAAYADQTENVTRLENQNQAALQARIDTLANRLAPAYAKVLGFIGRLLGVQQREEIPALERERRALNAAVFQVTAYAEGTEERTAKVRELQKEYPGFLGNIRAETASNEQLRKRLEEVNQEYANRIFLQAQNEQIRKTIEQVNDAYSAQGGIINQVSATLSRLQEQGLTGVDPNAQFGFVDIQQIVVEGDVIETYLQRIRAAREGLKLLFTPDDAEFFQFTTELNAAEQGLKSYGEIAQQSAGQLDKLKASRDAFVQQFGLQKYLEEEANAVTGSTNAAADAATKLNDLTAEIERLRIDNMQEGLEKRLALIDFEIQQQIAKLEGSAEQVAEATRLLEEKRRKAYLQALEDDVDDREAIRQKDEARAEADQRAAQQRQLQQLEAYNQQRIAEITEQTLAEAQAGAFKDQEAAEKAIQERLLQQLRAYLAERIRLLESFGEDASQYREQLARLDLGAVYGGDQGEDTGGKFLQDLANVTDAAGQIIGKFYDLQAAKARASYDDQIAALNSAQEKELSKRNLTEAQREQIEKRYAARRAVIDKQYREQERQRAIQQAIIDTAVLTIKALATAPAPNIPAAALAGVLAGIQTAIIANSKFERGGRLPQPGQSAITTGPSHSAGGIRLVDGNTGQHLGEVEGGETILSKAFTQNNPELVEAALYSSRYQGGRRIFAEGGVLPTVSTTPSADVIERAGTFNDRNIVTGLKMIYERLGTLELRIGEFEATQIMEMATEYESAKAATGL